MSPAYRSSHSSFHLDSSKIQEIVHLIRYRYPTWNGFDDPEFLDDEVRYKRATAERARNELDKDELRHIIAKKEYDHFIRRLEIIGRNNNLLYQNMPSQSDLNIIYHVRQREKGEIADFCSAMLYLLHGKDSSLSRLERYLSWVNKAKLPSKWTFPTYFLFFCHPREEFFVKPKGTRRFLRFLGLHNEVGGKITAEKYGLVRDIAQTLLQELSEYKPTDMVDIQSIFWVCARTLELNGDESIQGDLGLESRAYQDEDEDEIQPSYSLSECSAATGLDEEILARWVRSIRRKGQAIFYGPPGTGKTHVARKIARHLIGGGNGFSELIQFHPSYSYEEFIQGIRPETRPEGGLNYPLKRGRFLEFCDRAAEREGTCVLVIDEINRAHLSRVFGELMYLLEYRDSAIPLAAGESFSIPQNVLVLGTMNTADRSIALVDHALRRRFAFIGLSPNFEVLRGYHDGNGVLVDRLIDLLKRVNREIANPHYEIGITFFLKKDLGDHLEDIWTMEIHPYLEEYFFDQPEKSDGFRWERVRRELDL